MANSRQGPNRSRSSGGFLLGIFVGLLAGLAILGYESSVEPANLPDKGTWYRVRLGPYSKVDELNKVRQALAQNGIDASLVKIKEPQ